MNPFSQNNSTPISQSPGYWVVVPAAGIGARMGSSLPKQYLLLNDKTILEHTLTRLLQIPDLIGIVVAVSNTDSYWSTLAISQHSLIHTIQGGAERADSVLNGLRFLQDKLKDQDWVLVHDAARPCVTLSNIVNLCEILKGDKVGGILAIPVSDTIKNVGADNSILNTVDRRPLWQAQTPQLFRYKLLLDCLTQTLARKENITDEASALELCGFAPKVVEGRSDNIKITRSDDLALGAFILRNQEQKNREQQTQENK